MSVFKTSRQTGIFAVSVLLANFTGQILLADETNGNADLTTVFTGSHGRVAQAISQFSQTCAQTNKWLFISGVGQKTTLSAILKKHDVSVPAQCEKRILLGSHAQNTKGNAMELRQAIPIIRDDFGFDIKSVELRTSWCHTPRALTEIRNQLDPNINVSVNYAGSCDITTWHGAKRLLKETLGLPFAQAGKSDVIASSAPYSYKGQFRVGRSSLTATPHLRREY